MSNKLRQASQISPWQHSIRSTLLMGAQVVEFQRSNNKQQFRTQLPHLHGLVYPHRNVSYAYPHAPRLAQYNVTSRNPSMSSLASSSVATTSATDVPAVANVQEDLAPLIQEYAQKPVTPISIQNLLRPGEDNSHDEQQQQQQQQESMPRGRLGQRVANQRRLLQVAHFLQQELPIRLAHRINDLHTVPHMKDMPSVQIVKQIYIDSFWKIVMSLPIVLPKDDSSDDYADWIDAGSQQEESFAILLETLYQKHSNVLIQMAQGAYELRQSMNQSMPPSRTVHTTTKRSNNGLAGTSMNWSTIYPHVPMEECHTCLNRFYLSRVGIRVLAGHYLALRHQLRSSPNAGALPGSLSPSSSSLPSSPQYIGMICMQTSPMDIVLHAAADATNMCYREYGYAPEVEISGQLDLSFPYLPTHLHYILLELLKNAMRATMESTMEKEQQRRSNKNSNDDDDDVMTVTKTISIIDGKEQESSQSHYLYDGTEESTQIGYSSTSSSLTRIIRPPPVTVIISDSTENEDVIIKVMDEGGGIPRSQMDDIWSYLFTTADPKIQLDFLSAQQQQQPVSDHSAASPIAGLGYGLPMSRAYARYFGGEVDVISMEGYGTDAFVYLRRLQGNCGEESIG